MLLARAEGPHGFERVVVLKLLLAQFRDDASFERMFAREAAAYARLSHPAIVKLYDFFSAEGQLVMVLEHVDGLPLNKLRALLRPADLDDRASLFIASRIFSALAAAHSARDAESGEFAPVIHRDVNPSNVLIPWDGHAKLADFGIAKVAGMQGDTKAGYIKGTYGYMAPEQVRAEAVTPRTDVYAASLLLWELLARRKAIQRGALPDMEVLRAMAEPQLPSLGVLRPDLSAELRDAIERGLEPNPDRRAIFADELVAVLRASANLEEGRALLVDQLALVRPPAGGDDLEKTMMHPTRASMQSFADTDVADRPSLPTDTERVPSVADPTLENLPLPSFEGAPPPPPPAPPQHGQTLSFEMPASSRPPGSTPQPPRASAGPSAPGRAPLPPRPTTRTALGLGHTMPLQNGAPRTPPPPAASPTPPPVLTTTQPLTPPPAHAMPSSPPRVPPQTPPPPPPRFELPSFPVPPPPTILAPTAPSVPSRPPPASLPPMRASHPSVPAALYTPALMPVQPMPSMRPIPAAYNGAPMMIDPIADVAPPRGGNRWLLGGAVGFLVMCTVLVGGLLFLRFRAPPASVNPATSTSAPRASATTTSATNAPASTPAPTPTPTTTRPPAATPAPTPTTTTTAGDLDTTSARPQHRVFVDGRVVGETPGTFRIACGSHQVRLGSRGTIQNVDVPCGGVLKVTDR